MLYDFNFIFYELCKFKVKIAMKQPRIVLITDAKKALTNYR